MEPESAATVREAARSTSTPREASGDAPSASSARPLRADASRNRDRLVDAATEVFAQKGAEAPLEEVARAAGVGIGTLYRHFPTRDSLIEAVYRHEVDVLCAEADRMLETMPPDEALAAWLQGFVGHVARKRGMATALKAMLGSDAPTFFEQTRTRAVASANKLLAAGAAAGRVRADVDGSDLLRAVGGICMSTDQERTDSSQRLVGLLFDGLRHGATADAAQPSTAAPPAS